MNLTLRRLRPIAFSLCLALFPLGTAAASLPANDTAGALTQDPRDRLFAMLDHVNVVVADLDRAGEDWRRLGFAPSPGIRTADGLVNLHIGFPDGSEVELIRERSSRDSLAADYVRLASEGSGGAYAALRVRNLVAVRDRFARAGFPAEFQASGPTPWMMFAADHPCRPLWFFEASAPGGAGSQWGRHAIGATRLLAVWIARERLDDTLRVMLQIVGIPSRPDWD
ncbi:MAG TPA: VOC family protein, partial [Candidatus Eisenbacteria bacterium]|nr:VOC family protein [Candidatus Eisenbacteria bacterium]